MQSLAVIFFVFTLAGFTFGNLNLDVGKNKNWPNAFAKWKVQFNKSYATVNEEALRFNHFQASIRRITERNRPNNGKVGATFGLNHLSDLSPAEFRAKYLMPRRSPVADRPSVEKSRKVATPPKVFDWRSSGKVTDVKNQEQCGSCWAFSATETIESAYMLRHGLVNNTMKPLAPQQIVDCDTSDGGCEGGNPPTAYDYVEQAGGMETEVDYPYKGVNGNCKFQASKVYANIASWAYSCGTEDEPSLLQNTYTHGASSICVDAANWQDYQSGVMTAWQCAWINQLDHCVQAVGWNLNAATPYWSVRNSWTTQWGEQGYIRLEYGANTCGLTQEATYVVAV